MGFLKTLLIILLVYFLLRIIWRLLAPRLFRYAVKKTEDRFKEAFERANMNQQSTNTRAKDIDKNTAQNQYKKSSEQVGEYIDFEEIE
ncbi:MAG: DUF4834 family protein [Flavobacteriaceae bacterium]|nr:DUF4834 family protein [Muriicola sp.]NNC62768.1 DUF4834 family protein [Eudoraea sp.]NNK20245.1 DUF4834 family protein [Flavobacteriaceae bacterium]MBT8290140.1 DUF4834 family protein [Muriicola sp.]NNK35334.1 DUF4834 family protein [Eudoraea sp.]